MLKILWWELKMAIVQADALNLLVAQGLRTQTTANVQGTAQGCERTETSRWSLPTAQGLKPLIFLVTVVAGVITLLLQKLFLQKVKQENIKKNMNINCIVSCKRAAQVGTFNIRTAREQHKRIELAELFSRSKLHILALQEHRVVHAEPTRIKKMNKGIHPVISSAWRNAAGASNGRVGIILTRTAYEAISLIKSYSARILTMSFNRKPRLSVITCYSPTEASSDEEAENLFFLKPSILQLI